MLLAFAPQSDRLAAGEVQRLQSLRAELPVQTFPELFMSGPRSLQRARNVRDVLRRPVILYPAPRPASGQVDPDYALLVLPTPIGIIPDACHGIGEFGTSDAWPADDQRRAQLLPAGCSIASIMEIQAVRPTDLLEGRPLPEGASIPFADAIERYYHRNESGQSSAGAARNGGGSSAAGSAPLQQGGAETANPLMGPMQAGSP